MNVSRFLPFVTLLALLPTSLPAQKVPIPRLGVQLKLPKGWTEIPAVGGNRGQCVRFFAGERALIAKAGGTHTPTFRVWFFKDGLTDENDVVEGLPRTTPFRSLEDYVERGHPKGTRFTEREAARFGDFEGRFFAATVPNQGGDLTLLGASIPLEDGELVLEFEVLSDHAGKERKGYLKTLDDITKIDREAEGKGPPAAPWKTDPEAWKAMDAAAQKTAREKFAEAVVAAVADDPGIGWKIYKSKYWTVVSAADAGFTKKAITAAEVGLDWCEKHLDGISDAELMPAVLRIFESPDHLLTYKIRTAEQREYLPYTRELLFVDDPNAGTRDGWGPLFRAVLWHWMDDHAPGSVQAIPRWLDWGLWEYFRMTELRGKKIEFAPGTTEIGRMAYYPENNLEPPAIWNLIQESMQPSPENGEAEENWNYTTECSRMMRWFFEHDGSKAFGKENVIADYIRALGEAYQKVGPNPTADVDVTHLTDAQTKTMNERYYKWRDSMLVATNDIALPLQVGEWQAVNAKWLKFLEDFD